MFVHTRNNVRVANAKCSDGPLIATYGRPCLQNLVDCLIMGFFSAKYNLTFMLVVLRKALFRTLDIANRGPGEILCHKDLHIICGQLGKSVLVSKGCSV